MNKIVNIILCTAIIFVLTIQTINLYTLQEESTQQTRSIAVLNNLLAKELINVARIIDENLKDAKLEQKLVYYQLDSDYDNLNKKIDSINYVDTEKMLNGSVFVVGLTGLGSGTIVKKTAEKMYILTCYHVVRDVQEFNDAGEVKLPAQVGYNHRDAEGNNIGSIIYGAEIIKYDKENDLALLKTFFVDDELQEIKIAEESPIKGDVIYSVGNPLGLMRTISKGILANILNGYFIGDNTTTFGNSGGTLYNSKAELIGVPSQVLGYSVGNDGFVPESSLGFAIDLTRVKEFISGVL